MKLVCTKATPKQIPKPLSLEMRTRHEYSEEDPAFLSPKERT